MNILHLTAHLNTGGITSYLATLSAGLIQRGHRVTVVSSGGNVQERLSGMGVHCIHAKLRVKNQMHPGLYLQLPSLCRLIKKENIDILHAHTRTTQVLGTVLSALTGKPLVTTCHGFFKPHFFRAIVKGWGSTVIAISPKVAQHLVNDLHVPLDKIHLIVNGIDIDQFPAVTTQARRQALLERGWSGKRVIGIIGRLSDVKGIDVLIDAFALVRQTHANVLLLIVGDGPQIVKLKAQAHGLGLDEDVVFEVTVDKTARRLPLFEVFISPSRMEGLGLAVMEAMASALPVVASRVGGLVDLIQDGEDGYLIDPENSLQLADLIKKVLDAPEDAVKVGLKAREKIMACYNARVMVEQTLGVYEKNLGR